MSDDFEISLDAPPRVRDALKRIGRTEDVSFSPSNRRILDTLADASLETLEILPGSLLLGERDLARTNAPVTEANPTPCC